MNHLNNILIEGELIENPKSEMTYNKIHLCEFRMSSKRFTKIKDQIKESLSIFDIVTYGKLAQTCTEYLNKGRMVRVVGRLKQFFEKDEFGKEISKVKVVAEHVEIKPGKNNA